MSNKPKVQKMDRDYLDLQVPIDGVPQVAAKRVTKPKPVMVNGTTVTLPLRAKLVSYKGQATVVAEIIDATGNLLCIGIAPLPAKAIAKAWEHARVHPASALRMLRQQITKVNERVVDERVPKSWDKYR